jgi:hypothetical protein
MPILCEVTGRRLAVEVSRKRDNGGYFYFQGLTRAGSINSLQQYLNFADLFHKEVI